MEKKTETKHSLLGNSKWSSLITFVISVVIFAAISWIYFSPSVANGDVLRQSDVMQGMANGHETSEYVAKTGEVPRWTNALFGGMPTFQISPTYTTNTYLNGVNSVMQFFFPEPVSWLFLLMLGFFILLLAFDVKWYLAVLGAIGYAFSSYFIILMGAGHIWKLLTLAYIPPTIAGVVWAYRGHYLRGAAVAALFAALQLMSNHVQMTYYSAFIIVALAIAYLCVAIKEKKIGQWCIATAVLVVAALLALGANSPSLYMSYKYSQETMRGGHSELTPVAGEDGQAPQAKPTKGGLDKDYITQWSYGIDETFTLLVPNVKGGASIKPVAGENKPMLLGEAPQVEKLLDNGKVTSQDMQVLSQPYFLQYFGDQPMTNGPVYVGAIIFALFLLGCVVVKGPVKWALLAVTVLSVLLSWGHNFMGLTDLFIDHFPMYNKFRTVSSILVIAEFTMPVLAVLGLQKLFTEDDFMTKHSKALYGSFGVSALLCLLFALAPSLFGTFSAQETEAFVKTGQLQQMPGLTGAIAAIRHAMVSADAWRSMGFIIVAFALIFAYLKGWLKNATLAGCLLAAVVLIDLYVVDKRYLSEESFVSSFAVPEVSFTPREVDKQIMQDTTQNYRVLDLAHFGEPMPSYFHKTVGGYHAAKLSRYNDLIERQLSKNNMAVLNMLNTKYVIVADSAVQQNPQALGNAWFVDSITYVDNADAEMKFLDDFNPATSAVADAKFKTALQTPTPKQAGDTIYETTYSPVQLTYHSHSAGERVAVFSEVYFPWGWKATIDGKPAEIGRVNYVLRAMRIPAGDHTIAMTFDPQEVHTTETIAGASLIGILILILLAVAVVAVKGKKFTRKDDEEETQKPDNNERQTDNA